jgi:hypothetical protein
MRSAITALLLPLFFVTSLVTGFNTAELRDLGRLAEHYRHHVETHGERDLSVLEFLVDHFGGSAERDDEHRTLPLLGGGAAGTLTPVALDATIGVRLPLPVRFVGRMPDRADVPAQPSVGGVFQPPRM